MLRTTACASAITKQHSMPVPKRTKTHENQTSDWMASVRRLQRCRSGIQRELCSQASRQMGHEHQVTFITCRVGLHAADDALLAEPVSSEPRRSSSLVRSTFSMLPPHIISFFEPQCGFSQVAVPYQSSLEIPVASPEQGTGPVPACQRAVVHDRGRHPLQVLGRMKRFGAGKVRERKLCAPVWRWIH